MLGIPASLTRVLQVLGETIITPPLGTASLWALLHPWRWGAYLLGPHFLSGPPTYSIGPLRAACWTGTASLLVKVARQQSGQAVLCGQEARVEVVVKQSWGVRGANHLGLGEKSFSMGFLMFLKIILN